MATAGPSKAHCATGSTVTTPHLMMMRSPAGSGIGEVDDRGLPHHRTFGRLPVDASCQRCGLKLAGSIGAPVITANELAVELNVTADAVLTLLADMRELVLRLDSGVRDDVADAVRRHFRSQEASTTHRGAGVRYPTCPASREVVGHRVATNIRDRTSTRLPHPREAETAFEGAWLATWRRPAGSDNHSACRPDRRAQRCPASA